MAAAVPLQPGNQTADRDRYSGRDIAIASPSETANGGNSGGQPNHTHSGQSRLPNSNHVGGGKVILESVILTAVVVVALTLNTFWAARRSHDFNFLGSLLFESVFILMVFGLIQGMRICVCVPMTAQQVGMLAGTGRYT
ncbi:hypothetical protein GQ457_08G021190 [Hibiscus cannabinus]